MMKGKFIMKKWWGVDLRVPLEGHTKASIRTILVATGLLKGESLNDVRLVITKRGLGGGKGKQIGSDYERRIAGILGKWWGCAFRRTPSSGGWDKLSRDGQTLAVGDLYAPPEAGFPFSVECKKRRTAVNLYCTNSEFFLWWKQCCDDAASVNKLPMLVFNTDGTDYVALSFAVLVTHAGLSHELFDTQKDDRCLQIHRLQDLLEAQLISLKTQEVLHDGKARA
jgi:hypothetical protein